MKKLIFFLSILLTACFGTSYAQSGSNEMSKTIAYPTGEISSSSLLLEKVYPRKARVGRAYTYHIKVRNLTSFQLQDVFVRETIPSEFKVQESSPKYYSRDGEDYIWKIGSLEAEETVVITIQGKGTTKEAVPCCTSAEYKVPELCHKTVLEDPSIAVRVSLPQEKILCDTIPVIFTVENTGDSLLKDVTVKSTLPFGLTSDKRSNILFFRTSELRVRESKEFKVLLEASETGTYTVRGSAESDDLTATTLSKEVRIVQPQVAIRTSVNRREQYLGRALTYTIEVRNPTETDAADVVVRASFPEHAHFQVADRGGRITGDVIEWPIDLLAGGDSRRFQVTVKGHEFGEAKVTASAKGSCTRLVTDSARASLIGIPALLLEVIDLVDPVEVGGEQTYQIRVTNQGTAPAHNIQITGQLEGMSYVSDSGETRSRDVQAGQITFVPVGVLAPKESASWEIKALGEKPGDLRFRVLLDSDELTVPVEEAESTFVY